MIEKPSSTWEKKSEHGGDENVSYVGGKIGSVRSGVNYVNQKISSAGSGNAHKQSKKHSSTGGGQ